MSSRSWGAVGCAESNRTAEAVLPIDNRAAPARDERHEEQAGQDSHPDQRGWSSRCCCYTTGLLRSRPARIRTRTDEVRARHARRVTPRAFRERTTRIERASPGWKPGALPSELRPRGKRKHARLESNQRPLPSRGSALSTELRAWGGASGRIRTRTSAVRRARACR